jgi:hypothetical protein
MTAKGSVTPGMACGSRPVKRTPESGAFPTVGIRQRPGVKGAGPFAPLPPPPTAGWQIAQADQGGTGQVGTGSIKSINKTEFDNPSTSSRRTAGVDGRAGLPSYTANRPGGGVTGAGARQNDRKRELATRPSRPGRNQAKPISDSRAGHRSNGHWAHSYIRQISKPVDGLNPV